MIKVPKSSAKRLIDIHGWSGLVFGLALYIVVFSGAVVVFSHEIGAWSVSGHKLGNGLSGKIDNRLRALAEQVPKEYMEEVSIWQNSAGEVIAFFHTHVNNDAGQLSEKGVRFVLDPNSYDVIDRQEGFNENFTSVTSGYLEEFFIDLHVRLHAPSPIGLYLTGILGLVLLVSAVSGFILHRHLIKDMFLSPRRTTSLATARDRHNLAGTWGLFFSIILAFTGAFFSFATTLGLPVLAITAFEGDQEKAIRAIVGEPAVVDASPAAFNGIESVVSLAQQQDVAGSVPRSLFIQHWGRADALITTSHEPSEDTVFFSNHQFNGVTGEYLGQKTQVGQQPSAGNTMLSLMGVLHFGWFAGLLSRIIWFALGLATCYVTISGLELWLKRRQKNADEQYVDLAKLVTAIGYGLPVAMITAACGFIFTYSRYTQRVEQWTVNGFLIGVMLSFALVYLYPSNEVAKHRIQQCMALLLILVPLLRAVSHQSYFADLTVLAMDLSFIIGGFLFLMIANKNRFPVLFSLNKATDTRL